MKYPQSKEYPFTYYLGDLPVDCLIDYIAPSSGKRGDYGLVSPNTDAEAILNSVKIDGNDIMEFLDVDTINNIEQAFLNQEEE